MSGAANLDTAAVLAIGDELLAGAHPDLNSPHIAKEFADLGRRVMRIQVAPDDRARIAAALGELCAEYPLVVATGGLGPTLDDVTRHAAADAAQRELVHSDEAWAQVEAWWARTNRPMPASNRRQALIPDGATVLANAHGTAPGFQVRVGKAELFVLPGPPREMKPMLAEHVLPWLADRPLDGQVVAVRRFYLHGLSESVFSDAAGDWMRRGANPLMGVTAMDGNLSVRIVARGRDAAEVQVLLAQLGKEFLERFGEHVFSEDEPELAFALGKLLIEREISFAVAESCTGGLLTAQITRVPGISAVFQEGFVAYSNEAKSARLGIPASLIEAHGAVSEEVAAAMALGAAERSGSRVAVSTTGVAGPGGGTPEKPVGHVCFGLFFDGRVESVTRRFPALGRDRIRARAAGEALDLLLAAVRGK